MLREEQEAMLKEVQQGMEVKTEDWSMEENRMRVLEVIVDIA